MSGYCPDCGNTACMCDLEPELNMDEVNNTYTRESLIPAMRDEIDFLKIQLAEANKMIDILEGALLGIHEPEKDSNCEGCRALQKLKEYRGKE